jgi:hypothetical protein
MVHSSSQNREELSDSSIYQYIEEEEEDSGSLPDLDENYN